ncbi:hypothetical protein [Streptomyces sp. 769]|uniref:hypothetical protein n=1 Tax=Streptomyces sp. 769 TaxID=1262452 RepID=UPI0005822152|nr:hypothetical protein [Streptomyces sp. 769]AJC59233.1 hypothetical protein GZL_06666 [Streptomyces sp. 769]
MVRERGDAAAGNAWARVGRRPLDVARAVRRAVTGPPPAPESAAVLVTAVASD